MSLYSSKAFLVVVEARLYDDLVSTLRRGSNLHICITECNHKGAFIPYQHIPKATDIFS